VAISATGCAGNRISVGMITGYGVVAGCAAEFGMRGMAEACWIDVVFFADFSLVSVAGNAGVVFVRAVAKGIPGGLCLAHAGTTGHNGQCHDDATLRKK